MNDLPEKYHNWILERRKKDFVPKHNGFNWATMALTGAIFLCAVMSPVMYYAGSPPEEYFKAAARILLESIPVGYVVELGLMQTKERLFDPVNKRWEENFWPTSGPHPFDSAPLIPQ